MFTKEKLKARKEWFVLFAMAAVIFGFCTYRITETTQPIAYPDEFGYWSNSSFFIGQDWSAAAKSSLYYSYGYSLLLVPIRLLASFMDFGWGQMFQCAVLMHAMMLTGAFFIVRKLCVRYLSDMHWLVRDFACLAVMLYPSYIVYAHTTMTETALAFFFWVYLYVMMRVADKPTVWNHVCFALISFYMFTIHQRCLAVVIASVIIVIYIKLLRRNTLSQVTVFFATMYLYGLVHSAIKQKLQNDLYYANEPAGFHDVIGYVFSKRALVLLAVICLCILALWLIEKGYGRIILVAGMAAVVIAFIYIGVHADAIKEAAGTVDSRVGANDFAGQVWKVFDIFTLPGFLRLLISCAGKWFYLASASGLMVCFGILGLGKHFFVVLWDTLKRVWAVLCGRAVQTAEQSGQNIWLFGMFLTWLGVFGISAMGMMGIDRVDNLLYGRYHEFAACFLFLYGFYVLIHDTKWVRHTILFVAMYLLVGWLCQYLFDELQNDTFVVVHSVMISRVFHDYEVPYGKVWELAAWAVGACVVLCMLVKPGMARLKKAVNVRLVAVLLAACCFWGYMGTAIVGDYVMRVNKRIEAAMPTIVMWINRLSYGEKVFFVENNDDFRMGLVLQFNIPDESVELIWADAMTQDEVFYVVNTDFMHANGLDEKYSVVVETSKYTLLVPLDGEIYGRMEKYGF